MSRLLIPLLFSLLSGSVMAGGVEFFHGSFNEALSEAKKQDKLLFVDVYTEWCAPCKVMNSNVFPKDEVGALYNASFINYKLDAEKGDGPELAERYTAPGYPTFWFIDGGGELVHSATGGMDQALFIELGREALGEGVSYDDMLAKYNAGSRDVKLVQSMLIKAPLYAQKFDNGSAEANQFWASNQQILQQYHEARKTEELINADDFSIISVYLMGPYRGQRELELVFDHYDELVQIVPEGDVVGVVLTTNNQTINTLATAGDLGYQKYLEEIRTHPAIVKADKYVADNSDPNDGFAKLSPYLVMKSLADGLYALKQQDWQAYLNTSDEYLALLETVGEANAGQYSNVVAHLLHAKCDDKVALQRAEKLAAKAHAMDSKSLSGTFTYGQLLAKLGKNAEAKKILADSLSLYTGRMEQMKPRVEALIKTL